MVLSSSGRQFIEGDLEFMREFADRVGPIVHFPDRFGMERHIENSPGHDQPIRSLMPGVGSDPHVAWLFTREHRSVRLEVRLTGDQVRLLIAGPGSKRAILDFPDLPSLLDYQAAYERQLASEGFVLEQFLSERRRWPR